MAIDARNVSTDTKLIVSWTTLTTPSQWEWRVVTGGTVGYGGTLLDTTYSGYSESYNIAAQKGMEKMLQVCPLDVVGAGTTWHPNGTNVIRTSNGKPTATGWVGGRGAWISNKIYTKDSIKGSG
tara:strand:+ start:499 stop:870 length:372 start_codon:yes stop_codon:yes gene_type:complete